MGLRTAKDEDYGETHENKRQRKKYEGREGASDGVLQDSQRTENTKKCWDFND